jgi:hypothetical protein
MRLQVISSCSLSGVSGCFLFLIACFNRLRRPPQSLKKRRG